MTVDPRLALVVNELTRLVTTDQELTTLAREAGIPMDHIRIEQQMRSRVESVVIEAGRCGLVAKLRAVAASRYRDAALDVAFAAVLNPTSGLTEVVNVAARRTALGVLGVELAQALENRDDTHVVAVLERLGVPRLTVSSREVAAWVERVTQQPLEDSEVALIERAHQANSLGNSLRTLGQYQEALVAMQRAVEIYRTLSAHNPNAFLPNLATSLNTLGTTLNDFGRLGEALRVTTESVEIQRILSAYNPEVFLPNFAVYLTNLSNQLCDLNQFGKALEAMQEVEEIYRTLNASDKTFHLELAASLNTTSKILNELGQREEGLRVARESFDLYWTFFERTPVEFAQKTNDACRVLLTCFFAVSCPIPCDVATRAADLERFFQTD
jgi:tetratricopeptide (TPR) repeat protein